MARSKVKGQRSKVRNVAIYPVLLMFLLISSTAIAVDPGKARPLAPLPLNPPIPTDNPSGKNLYPSPMDKKQELGYLLFFDPKITGDASLSCGDCHDPKQGWGTNESISRGYPGTVHWRNSQTVINSGYLNKIFWEGSVTALEPQASVASTGGVAGNGSPDMMESRLRFTGLPNLTPASTSNRKGLRTGASFQDPTLRYLKYTAPYMHNGTLSTLDKVIDFYDKGGGVDRWGNKTKILKPLNLTKGEKEALKEFLLTLSGEEIRLPVPKVPDYAPMADWQPKK